MKRMFEVTYFDPRGGEIRRCIESFTVLAHNAMHAIQRADSLRSFRYLRAQSVELKAVADK